MGIYTYDSGQHIFDRALWGLWMVAKWLLKAVIYLPLWFAGYMITSKILQKDDSAFAWIGLILLFAVVFYQLIFFIKGIMIGLKNKGNLIWLLLLLVCVGFTCVFPVWMLFGDIETFMVDLSKENGTALAWIFSIAFGLYVYSQYHFLTDIAPAAAYPAYQLGVDIII